jgi:hypothetical protein
MAGGGRGTPTRTGDDGMTVTSASTATTQALPPNHTTRLLCSAVLIRKGFAELVFRMLCVPRIQAVAPAPGIDLVLLARHAAHAVHVRRRCQQALALTLVAAVGLIGGIAAAPGLAGPGLILVLVLVAGVKVWVVDQEVALAARATGLIESSDVDDVGAGLVAPDQEQRLAAVNDANLSIYSWARADDPFPGLGQRIDAHVRMPVQVNQAGDPAKPVVPVTTSKLLDHLAREIPNYIDVTHVTDSRRVRMVLYVAGTAVKHRPDLLTDPLGPPVVRVPPQRLKATADQPDNAARTYLRAQIIGRGGQVITTLHLSAVVGAAGLSLDVALHVLRPLHTAYHAADQLPRERGRLFWKVLQREGLNPGLLAAPGAALRLVGLVGDANTPAKLTREQRRAVGTQDFYGALIGLRELASINSTLEFVERTDADRQGNDLVVGVLSELIEYLDSCNVDTSAFKKQKQDIINNFNTAINTTVNGPYVTGGQGGLTVAGNLNASQQNAPNLTPTGP